jgi:hypothetical protein
VPIADLGAAPQADRVCAVPRAAQLAFQLREVGAASDSSELAEQLGRRLTDEGGSCRRAPLSGQVYVVGLYAHPHRHQAILNAARPRPDLGNHPSSDVVPINHWRRGR